MADELQVLLREKELRGLIAEKARRQSLRIPTAGERVGVEVTQRLDLQPLERDRPVPPSPPQLTLSAGDPLRDTSESLQRGFEQGFTELALGGGQIISGGLEATGLITPEQGAEAQQIFTTAATQERESFEAETSENQIAGFIGRIGGNIAGTLPIILAAPATIPGAALAGAGFGLLLPTETKDPVFERFTNAQLGAVFGAGSQAALPIIGKFLRQTGNKITSIAAAAFEKQTGRQFGKKFIDNTGEINKEGLKALNEMGIKIEDVRALGAGLSDKEAKRIQNSFVESIRGKTRGEITDPEALVRQARAEEFEVPLTSARINQDFTQQQAENTLRTIAGSVEGEEARTAARVTLERLQRATDRFSSRLGGIEGATESERGAFIRSTVIDVARLSKQEVSRLYNVAKDIVGQNRTVDRENILEAFLDGTDVRAVEPSIISAMERALAKFGVIGEPIEGVTNAVLFEGRRIPVKGNIEPLVLGNAEAFRKRLNAIGRDVSGVLSSVIKQLDDDVQASIETAVRGKQAGAGGAVQRQEAVEAARGARAQFGKEFEAKDIIQDLTRFKLSKGFETDTPQIAAEEVRRKIFNSRGLTNLRRLKQVLLKKTGNTAQEAKGQTAWLEIQNLAIDDLFSSSIGPTGELSGLRLNSAVKKLGGDEILKTLLPKKTFEEFKRLQQLIGDATIDIKGTINPSGTGQAIINGLLNLLSALPVAGRTTAAIARAGIDKVADDAAKQTALKSIRQPGAKKLTPEIARKERNLATFLARFGVTGATRETATTIRQQ